MEAFQMWVGLFGYLGIFILRLVLKESASTLWADLTLCGVFFQIAHHSQVRELVSDDTLEIWLHSEELLSVQRLIESDVDLFIVMVACNLIFGFFYGVFDRSMIIFSERILRVFGVLSVRLFVETLISFADVCKSLLNQLWDLLNSLLLFRDRLVSFKNIYDGNIQNQSSIKRICKLFF